MKKEEKRIVIVGATSGIGREVALQLVGQGHRVGVAGRRIAELQALKDVAPAQVAYRQLDVTTDDAPQQLLALADELGGMDTCLLCAGIGKQNPELQTNVELATVQTNAMGFVRIVDTAYAYFRSHGGGHLAIISSIAGTKGLGVAPAYSATKRFQNTYIDALAQLTRMQQVPIYFTDIRPGFVNTALLAGNKRYPLMMNTTRVAHRIVRALQHRERVCIIDGRYRLLVALWKLIPRVVWERLPVRN